MLMMTNGSARETNGKTIHNVVQVKFLVALLFACSTAIAQNYDLVINGGRVMDPETINTTSPMSG